MSDSNDQGSNEPNRTDESIEMHGDKSYYWWTKNINRDKVAETAAAATPALVKTELAPSEDSLPAEQKQANRLIKAKKIDKFLWFDSDERVKVHAELSGVKEFKEGIASNFTSSSFDVFIPDYTPPGDKISESAPADLRLAVVELANPIVPGESKIVVKADKIIVSMKKEDPSIHWYNLRSDNRTKPAGANKLVL